MSDQKPTGHPTVIDIHVDDKDTLDALAEAIAPDADIEVIGARPGEKTHESLTSPEEAARIREFERYLVITPPMAGDRIRSDGDRVSAGFTLKSNSTRWLNCEEMDHRLAGLLCLLGDRCPTVYSPRRAGKRRLGHPPQAHRYGRANRPGYARGRWINPRRSRPAWNVLFASAGRRSYRACPGPSSPNRD